MNQEDNEYSPLDFAYDYLVHGKPDDTPQEVWLVLNWPFEYMGVEQYNEFQAIKKKYPQYFPWETRYDEIPKEVHEAYQREIKPWLFEKYKETDESQYSGKGLIDYINSSKPIEYKVSAFTIEDFDRVCKEHFDEAVLRAKQYKKDKAIWDKHYKKYGLPYNG